MFWNVIWILTVVSLVLSIMGFYKFVYFLSIGYGLAVMGEGAAIAVMAILGGSCSAATLIQCALFIFYGFRLSGFLLLRELKNTSFRKSAGYEAINGGKAEKKIPVFVSAFVWIFCAILYTAQVSPVFFRAMEEAALGTQAPVWQWIGIVVMIAGAALETIADKQKSAQKKVNPKMVATQGLFTLCRCPNYFGEILFWTGVILSGIGVIHGVQIVVGVIGYICIVYIMINGAQRLEKRQNKTYGDKQEYRDYTAKTPILFPFIPIYHLVKEEK